jgi:spore germination protein KB
MEKISKHQLFCITMMGQIGSTNLWALGIKARQDAWIVILFSLLVSLGFIWVFTELYNNYPNDNIAGLSIALLGRVIGYPLLLIYVLMNLFNVTRNSGEFADLINITFLQETPRIVITLIFLVSIIYILFLKVETFARLMELILPLVLVLLVSIYIMIVASGRLDLGQLRPVLGKGIMPVIRASYPVPINFPFSIVLIKMQLWPYVEKSTFVRKTTFSAVILSGFILSATLIVIVCTLGSNLAADATIPFLEVIKLINIADIITNMDAIGVILIYTGGFIFAILNFFSAAAILSTILKVKDYRWFLIPLGVIVLWYVNVYEPNYPYHVKFLEIQYWQQMVPLIDIIPVLLLLILWLKKCGRRCSRKTTG